MELKVRGNYDVIVIGGGHAGLEAARAAARALNGRGTVALLTMDEAGIGRMSCNPAIGGLAKGQIVREIDALGSLMGRAADASGIMFKMLEYIGKKLNFTYVWLHISRKGFVMFNMLTDSSKEI